MSPDSTEIEEPGVDELERAMRAAGVPQVSHVPHPPQMAQACVHSQAAATARPSLS